MLILCRNPWGKIKKGNWEGAWSDGSKEWTTEVKEELGHTFGSDSTFWISYEDLFRKYQHFDRTRLFRDPDWRSCQRWVGVEVPWKPQYNEKFHIKLTKESPLVIVLSQLDNRYFRGLQGQYNFRLQFRLHKEGSPGAEEYIVRSHGNYLMDRSVSVELPNVEPGNYVVFMSIIGERDTCVLSTEDVIKRECKGREENEKLAQVGQAYDLAHSKASSHLERLSKVRKKSESKKASESRRKERRKNWEKRQIGRDIAAKQKAKDESKKAKLKAEKRAKAEAEAKAQAEKEAAERVAAEKREAAEKAAAEKAAEEERKKQAELQPKDMAVQTENRLFREEGSQTEADADNVSTTSTLSSTGSPQYTPQDSPASQVAHPMDNNNERVNIPPVGGSNAVNVSGGPPPQPAPETRIESPTAAMKPIELKVHCCSCDCSCKKPARVEESDGYSSDSPVEDYENLYDEDDVTPTLRLANTAATPVSATTNGQDSDDEDAPDPWNAIAVIGFRVYSKDEDLELRVIMEGGELEQDGMGSLGEADLDNAVSNAAGQRQRKQEEEPKTTTESGKSDENNDSKKVIPQLNVITANATDGDGENKPNAAEVKDTSADGMASYRTIIERKTSEFDRVMGKLKAATQDNQPAEENTKGEHVDTESSVVQASKNESKSEETTELQPQLKKVILLIRSKIQKCILHYEEGLKEEDMTNLSDALTNLEEFLDLESNIISATKINKVMRAVTKLPHIPKDEELSIRSRAQQLLDEYELTLLAGDD